MRPASLAVVRHLRREESARQQGMRALPGRRPAWHGSRALLGPASCGGLGLVGAWGGEGGSERGKKSVDRMALMVYDAGEARGARASFGKPLDCGIRNIELSAGFRPSVQAFGKEIG